MDHDYASFGAVVDRLHQANIRYLVMRNYGNLLTPGIFEGGHEDIDMLCTSSRAAAEALHAAPCNGRKGGDGVHYSITIQGQKVSLDLRSIGDGYYCEQWQRDMLRGRVLRNGFYVMGDEHHFYSLLYHAVLQKRALSPEYAMRLAGMASAIGVTLAGNSERDFMETLDAYMRRHGYTYCYCTDVCVPLRAGLIDKRLLRAPLSLSLRHRCFEARVRAIELLVRIKHLLEGRG